MGAKQTPQIKTYKMLTRDRRLVDVPREGNRIAAAQQGLGYGLGYGAGIISALLIEPLVDTVKDTHLARGMEHGWVQSHYRVDQVKATTLHLRTKTDVQLMNELTDAGVLTGTEKLTGIELARLRAQYEISGTGDATKASKIVPFESGDYRRFVDEPMSQTMARREEAIAATEMLTGSMS